ncbi:hypothetical protein PV325_004594 [Microctonus aethiopoides]|nr:hypothetical protein PV325_004594 [Microctonus aethiopoides]KAK0089704.1 hypothetical protein PV326_004391 [Microctonus aethiopoides]
MNGLIKPRCNRKLKLYDLPSTEGTPLTPQSIDMTLGVNHYSNIIKANIIRLQEDMPIVQLSIFGWLVLGPCGHHRRLASRTNHLTIQQEHESLQELMTKF